MDAGFSSLILLPILLALYFIPSIIAVKRHHPSTGAIVALNFFVGWTFLGWIGAIVWSLSAIANTPGGYR